MKNSTAARRTIAAMRDTGKIQPADDALVHVVLSLAAAVDRNPDSAPLWREYRAAVQSLRSASESDPDPFGDFVAELFSEMGDQTST